MADSASKSRGGFLCSLAVGLKAFVVYEHCRTEEEEETTEHRQRKLCRSAALLAARSQA